MNKNIGLVSIRLHRRIASVAPLVGLSLDSLRIDYAPEATAEQRAAAQAILDAFDPAQAQAEVEAEETAERARQEWLKTAKSEVDALKVQKADKAAMESMQNAIAYKDALISKLSTDVATLTTQLQEANTKLSELDQLKADVAALKSAKVEPTK